ncbi:hypothetical protein B0H15DRAFT_195406 [Mycena belliarum]|uniref:Uncharacterized protein n=1 Tax=Mycena belliarum TaxID=1033014 RepID=A0AAD6UI00_9AGAR|nr:hypothetical protein B0H15DRAFT_195406 [Mycena belliae]
MSAAPLARPRGGCASVVHRRLYRGESSPLRGAQRVPCRDGGRLNASGPKRPGEVRYKVGHLSRARIRSIAGWKERWMAWIDWVSRGVVVEGWAAVSSCHVLSPASSSSQLARWTLSPGPLLPKPQPNTQLSSLKLGAGPANTMHQRARARPNITPARQRGGSINTRRSRRRQTTSILNHGRPPASRIRYNLSCIAMTSCSIDPRTHRSSGTPLTASLRGARVR